MIDVDRYEFKSYVRSLLIQNSTVTVISNLLSQLQISKNCANICAKINFTK